MTDLQNVCQIYDWVAMDPADVAKVMRLETTDWIKHTTSPLGFFMYPVSENVASRFDSYAPDDFKYQFTASEIKA